MVYMVKSGNFYKIGYTANFEKRLENYMTHNPNIEVIDTVKTYAKTKRQLEKVLHAEIKAYGFECHKNREWFIIPEDRQEEFNNKGLKMFKACQNRKTCKSTTA